MKKYQDLAVLLLRLATGANFASAVASRLGFWGARSSGWDEFVKYTGSLNSFAPAAMIPFLAVSATVLESLLAILLIIGYKTRIAATVAGMLTLTFALAMSYTFSPKDALDYSVFVDSASAFLLATIPVYRWSVDDVLKTSS